MSEPKRYKLRPIFLDYTQTMGLSKDQLDQFGEHAPYFDKEGNWVKWEDYARLKAEVERLTKAGDAMAADLIGEFGSYNSVDEWNAAKEGKQS